jgi:hypothetical protein
MMSHTIAFFETQGKRKLTDDDHARTWYADFLAFQKQERLFATLLTPPEYGEDDGRWDSWRNFEFNEILAFYQYCLQMLRKPAVNLQQYQRVWEHVYALKGLYDMPA